MKPLLKTTWLFVSDFFYGSSCFILMIMLVLLACKKTKSSSNTTPSQITLISPTDRSSIQASGDNVFRWSSTIASSAGSPVYYKIKIAEITGDQSPDAALRGNKPHFERDSLRELSFIYPRTTDRFLAGKKYAWKILTSQTIGTQVKDSSLSWGFSVQ